jgi:hypothetical protein
VSPPSGCEQSLTRERISERPWARVLSGLFLESEHGHIEDKAILHVRGFVACGSWTCTLVLPILSPVTVSSQYLTGKGQI